MFAKATVEYLVVTYVGRTFPQGHPLSTDHANDGIVSHPHRSSWLESLLNTEGSMTSVYTLMIMRTVVITML